MDSNLFFVQSTKGRPGVAKQTCKQKGVYEAGLHSLLTEYDWLIIAFGNFKGLDWLIIAFGNFMGLDWLIIAFGEFKGL